MGWESFVGLMSVQISVEPSTGFSVTGRLQWEAFSISMTGLPDLLTYSSSVNRRVCTACDSGILGTGRRVEGSELVSATLVPENQLLAPVLAEVDNEIGAFPGRDLNAGERDWLGQ